MISLTFITSKEFQLHHKSSLFQSIALSGKIFKKSVFGSASGSWTSLHGEVSFKGLHQSYAVYKTPITEITTLRYNALPLESFIDEFLVITWSPLIQQNCLPFGKLIKMFREWRIFQSSNWVSWIVPIHVSVRVSHHLTPQLRKNAKLNTNFVTSNQ